MRMPSLPLLLQSILAAGLVASFILYLVTGVASTAFPYDLSYGEGPVLDQARRAATGQEQYRLELERPPYVVDNYPPLYPLLVGGISATTNFPLLQAGRAVSLFAGLLAGILVGIFAWRLSGRRFSAALAAGLFLGNLFVLVWAPRARVDMLALALSLAGLWLIYRKWSSWSWLSLAIVCLVAAAYTRQTYALAAPVASAIWLWHNDRCRSVLFGAAFLTVCVSLFVLLNAATSGGFYLHTVSVYAGHSYQLRRAAQMLGALFGLWSLAVAVAGIGLVGTLLRFSRTADEDADRRYRPFVVWGLVPYTLGALISALAAGKVGSDVNYVLELIAAVAIWTALGAAQWPGWGRLRHHHTILLLAGQVIISLLLGWRLVWQQGAYKGANLREFDWVFRRVQAAVPRGPVLADEYLGMVVLAGQPIYFQPFDYRQLYVAGTWDPAALIGEIGARRFPLILLNGRGTRVFDERWIPAIVEAIDASYCPSERVGDLVIYEPSASLCPASP